MHTLRFFFFFFSPAELKLNCRNVFAVTFQQFGWEQITYLHPESLKQTSVCEKKGVRVLWVFIFHSCSISFFLPVQRCFVNAWSFLTLKVAVTNFPFVLYVLQCYRFFFFFPFLSYFYLDNFKKLHSPPKYTNFTVPGIIWSFDRPLKQPRSDPRFGYCSIYYWKQRFLLKHHRTIWSRCVFLLSSNNAFCLRVAHPLRQRAPSNWQKPDTIWGETEIRTRPRQAWACMGHRHPLDLR